MMKIKRLNILDILIIIVAVVAVILLVVKLLSVNKEKGMGVQSAYETVIYTAEIDCIRQATVDSLHIGDKLYDDTTNTYIGKITDIDTKPYLETEISSEGNAIIVEKPNYYIAIITVEGEVLEKESGYYLNGVVELKSNSNYKVYTKFACPEIRISSIEFTNTAENNISDEIQSVN